VAQRIDREVERIMRAAGGSAACRDGWAIEPARAGRLLLSAYPDRAAWRTSPVRHGVTARLLLATGRAARVAGALAEEEFLVIADMDGGDTEARVFLAAPIARADIEAGLAGVPETTRLFTWNGWIPKSRKQIAVGSIVLGEKAESAPPREELEQAVRERLLREGIGALPWDDGTRRFISRCRFAGKYGKHSGFPDFTNETILDTVGEWLFPYGNWSGNAVFTAETLMQALTSRIGWKRLRELDHSAPESITLPSGTKKRLDYETGDIPIVAARLQEFFGCRETPRASGEPLLLHLLSPAGRPIQITRDIDGFWERAYPAVRKELRGRYPKHPWPDDPRTASPTARTKRHHVDA
jgi:ATP-dependent helicase HrpB